MPQPKPPRIPTAPHWLPAMLLRLVKSVRAVRAEIAVVVADVAAAVGSD